MPLYISEYQVFTDKTVFHAAQEPCITDQTPVVIGAGSLQSAAFNAKTAMVRVHTDANCCIKFGEDPTATTSSKRLAAGQTEYFQVGPAQKVAVIAVA